MATTATTQLGASFFAELEALHDAYMAELDAAEEADRIAAKLAQKG